MRHRRRSARPRWYRGKGENAQTSTSMANAPSSNRDVLSGRNQFPDRSERATLVRVKNLKSCCRAAQSWALTALIAFLGVASVSGASGQRRQPALESPEFQALPLERSRQNHFLLRAEINGKPALLGVDTGAPVSAISAARRAHFGMSAIPSSSKLPPRLRINGGFNRVTIAPQRRLGALILVYEPMVAIDLSAPARAAREFHEQELDGILGADILFPTQAVLDCKQRVLFMKLD